MSKNSIHGYSCDSLIVLEIILVGKHLDDFIIEFTRYSLEQIKRSFSPDGWHVRMTLSKDNQKSFFQALKNFCKKRGMAHPTWKELFTIYRGR